MANVLVIDDENKFIYAINNEGFLDKWDFKMDFLTSQAYKTTELISSLKNPAFDVFYLEIKVAHLLIVKVTTYRKYRHTRKS